MSEGLSFILYSAGYEVVPAGDHIISQIEGVDVTIQVGVSHRVDYPKVFFDIADTRAVREEGSC
ncbi:MAG: hypothetical protein ACREDR_49330, partial [Blastocatellia bacterium]